MNQQDDEYPLKSLTHFSAAVFYGYFGIGAFLPTLPLYLSAQGYSSFVVGALVGAQPLATLLSRGVAGNRCDALGPRPVVILGFLSMVAGGALHLGFVGLNGAAASLFVLLFARLVLGFGESFFISALSTWSIATVGNHRAGRAMSWSGMAMYGALVVSAPIALSLAGSGGFGLVALSAMIAAFCGLIVVRSLPSAKVVPSAPARVSSVIGDIWDLGLALSLASIGVGTITTFIVLRFQTEHWAFGNYAMLAFGAAFLGVRAILSGLPDRADGGLLATICLVAEALGHFGICLASSATCALAGVVLAGAGYALVFPALGVKAIDRVAVRNRGLVIAVYLGCFDLGLAVSGPLAGAVTRVSDVRYAFLAAGLAAASAAMLINARHLGRRSG